MTIEIHQLLRKLPGQDWWGRQELISRLLEFPEEDYLDYLDQGIRNHEDADLRNTAMEVYRALGSRAHPALKKLLQDDDPETRLFAVNILSGIGSEDAFPLLCTALKDHDINVRVASAEGLGGIRDPRAVKLLGGLLDDEKWVVMAALYALGDIGGKEALALLYGCLDKREHRELAISAIERAGTKDSIRHLGPCLRDAGLGGHALKAIVSIARRERVRPDPDYFAALAPLIVQMINASDPETKKYSKIALCWSRDIKWLPQMIEALEEDDLQEYAIEGLLLIGRKAVCGIVDALKGSKSGHRVILAKLLNMVGGNVALLQFCDDGDPEVRTEVALALGLLDMDRAKETLLRMLSDPSDEVRAAARKSLDRSRQ